MRKYSDSKKKGCPICDGVDPKSCMRCYGKTRLCDWFYTTMGWATMDDFTDNQSFNPERGKPSNYKTAIEIPPIEAHSKARSQKTSGK